MSTSKGTKVVSLPRAMFARNLRGLHTALRDLARNHDAPGGLSAFGETATAADWKLASDVRMYLESFIAGAWAGMERRAKRRKRTGAKA